MIENSEQKKKKPEMRNRKHPQLWQAYLWYIEVLEMKKRHDLRIEAIKKDRSNMDLTFEENVISDMNLVKMRDYTGKVMANVGKTQLGDVWDWVTGFKGLGSGVLAAQLLAQIDDIERFATISKLWRFAGYAVFDGKAEPKGFQAPQDEYFGRHYNGRLKGTCYNIAQSFIKHQCPDYVDVYYEHKASQREKYPVAICRTCLEPCEVKQKKQGGKLVDSFVCPNNGNHSADYTGMHLQFRAIRKMMQMFLKDLWLFWRVNEGLPISEPFNGLAAK